MSLHRSMKGSRYEVSTIVGPCSQDEVEALADAILELDEHKAVGGGGVSVSPFSDEEDE